jgi:hypothetical protein
MAAFEAVLASWLCFLINSFAAAKEDMVDEHTPRTRP